MPALMFFLYILSIAARLVCALVAVDNLVDVLHGDTTFETVWSTAIFAWLAVAPFKFEIKA